MATPATIAVHPGPHMITHSEVILWISISGRPTLVGQSIANIPATVAVPLGFAHHAATALPFVSATQRKSPFRLTDI